MFNFDSKNMSVDFDEDGALSSYNVQVSRWKIVIPVFPDEAEKRTASVLWIWINKLHGEITEVISRYNGREDTESEITIQIHGITDFLERLGHVMTSSGYSIDDLKENIEKNNIFPMGIPNGVILIIRDDIHLEYYPDDNFWERLVTGTTLSMLLPTILQISGKLSNEETSKLVSNIPSTPKIHTHAVALACVGMLSNHE